MKHGCDKKRPISSRSENNIKYQLYKPDPSSGRPRSLYSIETLELDDRVAANHHHSNRVSFRRRLFLHRLVEHLKWSAAQGGRMSELGARVWCARLAATTYHIHELIVATQHAGDPSVSINLDGQVLVHVPLEVRAALRHCGRGSSE